MFIFSWFAATLRQYPEIAIFLTLGSRLLLRQIHLSRASASGLSPPLCWRAS